MKKMTQGQGLRREERLRGKHELELLFAEGRKGYAGPLRYFWHVRPCDEGAEAECLPSVLFSVPKRFLKRANKRNLMKRRTREAYRLNKQQLLMAAAEKRVDVRVAFVYNTATVHDYKTVENGVRNALGKIQKSL